MPIYGKVQSPEYSWDDRPFLLPVSLNPSEWNSIYIAFYVAEVTGSFIYLAHVKNYQDTAENTAAFLKQVEEFAKNLRVKYAFKEIDLKKQAVGVEEIAKSIVEQAEELRVQAIIMAANRETFFREMFGRISDRVVNASLCKIVLVETPRYGMKIPTAPKIIFIPFLREEPKSDPFIIASALSSSASTPDVEIIAAWVVPLPPTIPLDALENAEILRSEEQEFSQKISGFIGSIGRFFSPRMIAVRHVGEDVASFAKEKDSDLMILQGSRGTGGYKAFMKSEKYEIVSKAPCVVLVVYN